MFFWGDTVYITSFKMSYFWRTLLHTFDCFTLHRHDMEYSKTNCDKVINLLTPTVVILCQIGLSFVIFDIRAL